MTVHKFFGFSEFEGPTYPIGCYLMYGNVMQEHYEYIQSHKTGKKNQITLK